MADETPSARARRERLERIWPTAKKAKRTKKPAAVHEPIPDEADDGNGTPIEEPAQTSIEETP